MTTQKAGPHAPECLMPQSCMCSENRHFQRVPGDDAAATAAGLGTTH